MKTINNYINEKRFVKQYTGNKNPNISDIENNLKEQLVDKSISCNIDFDGNTIKLNILNNLREGIVGHIVEDVVIETLSNLGIGKTVNKRDNGSDFKDADLLIDNEPWEVKAFNKQINEKTGTVLKGISFTYKQTQSEEGYPIIFVQYEMKETNIVIKDVKCRYPDDIVWSKGNSGRGTVVKLN
jgi:hypothetical protein